MSTLKAIDLFAGWGGFTLGARQAGVDVVWASNHWPLAVDTHRRNHPRTAHTCQDLRQADWTELPQFDLLLASPACQGHSSASQPRRRLYHDALRSTAFSVIDCADVCRPKAIVVENVPSFTRWGLYEWWVEGLRHLGYQVQPHVLTASQFDTPQRRKRLFLVATLQGVHVGTLTPTSTEPGFSSCLQPGPHAWKPVRTAPSGVQARIEAGRRRHGRRFLTQHTTGHPGVPLHEPIRTITCAPQHWNLVDGDRYRSLTSRELARGMGFPDSFTWDESLSVADVTRGLGNAVCPPVARHLVTRLADALS